MENLIKFWNFEDMRQTHRNNALIDSKRRSFSLFFSSLGGYQELERDDDGTTK